MHQHSRNIWHSPSEQADPTHIKHLSAYLFVTMFYPLVAIVNSVPEAPKKTNLQRSTKEKKNALQQER